MPGERSLEYAAAGGWHVRSDVNVIQAIRTRPLLPFTTSEMPTVEVEETRVTLIRHRVAAPCPYVGEKAWYAWWTWLDDCGQGWADTTVERVVQGSH